MQLSSLVFHLESVPDFNKLIVKGWIHPLGLRDEELKDSLVKTFGQYQLQIINHKVRDWKWTEAYIYIYIYIYSPSNKIQKKSEGKGMSLETVLEMIVNLYEELEDIT